MKTFLDLHIELDLKAIGLADDMINLLEARNDTFEAIEYHITASTHFEIEGKGSLQSITRLMERIRVVDVHTACRVTVEM